MYEKHVGSHDDQFVGMHVSSDSWLQGKLCCGKMGQGNYGGVKEMKHSHNSSKSLAHTPSLREYILSYSYNTIVHKTKPIRLWW